MIPTGAWTLALGPDLVESVASRRREACPGAADGLLAAGAIAAVGAALAGLADWRTVHGRERRTGFVHAALNSSALALNIASTMLETEWPSRARRAFRTLKIRLLDGR